MDTYRKILEHGPYLIPHKQWGHTLLSHHISHGSHSFGYVLGVLFSVAAFLIYLYYGGPASYDPEGQLRHPIDKQTPHKTRDH